MKRLAFSIFIAVLLAGCAHGQIPPTTWQATVTWQLPAPTTGWGGCIASDTCVFGVSRVAIATGAQCPAATGTTYALVGTSTSQAVSFVDPSVNPGQSYCYIVQTQQVIPPATQPATSAPSNTASVAIPPNPGVPLAPNATPTPGTSQSGEIVKPALSDPSQPNPIVLAASSSSATVHSPLNVSVKLVAKR